MRRWYDGGPGAIVWDMDGTPQRPAGVPDDATWVAEAAEWQHGALDQRGDKQGVHRTWREDGTLREEVTFVDGHGVGGYRRYHPNGQVAGRGEFVDGNLHGILHAFKSDGPTPERLQSCCVPPGAWELQTEYDRGQQMARRWYDRGGQQILDSGAPHPPWPASVPRDARYDEASGRWIAGSYDADAGKRARWQRWSREGVLVEQEELQDSVRHGVWRLFRDADGIRCFEAHFRNGAKHGPYYDASVAIENYADPRANAEEGQYESDLAVGIWRLLDEHGTVIAQRDLGVGADEETLARSTALADDVPALGPPGVAARILTERSRALAGERRLGEAIIAAARAAALSGDAAPLRDLLATLPWPRTTAGADELAAAIVDGAGDNLAPLVDGLLRGGAAHALLRAMASALKGRHRVALQLVDAALLLMSDYPSARVTRALVNVHLGAPEQTARDLAHLPEDWVGQREQLEIYQRIIFPTFDFWPARTAVSTMFQEYPEAPAQPLEAVHRTIGKLATRLRWLRAEMRRQLEDNHGAGAADGVAWLPPDVSALLPDGPVELEARTFEQTFEPEEGDGQGEPQVETISIDERLDLDAISMPGLLRLARRDWTALTWLCWSCGLDRVALPDAIAPPPDFGPAAGMSIERAWRCRDKLTTGGLVALSKGVPGFDWEGIDIDAMPRALIDIVSDEYTELRAMFLWLCDETAESPWQGDLRTPD